MRSSSVASGSGLAKAMHALGRIGAGGGVELAPAHLLDDDAGLGGQLADVLEHRCRVEVLRPARSRGRRGGWPAAARGRPGGPRPARRRGRSWPSTRGALPCGPIAAQRVAARRRPGLRLRAARRSSRPPPAAASAGRRRGRPEPPPRPAAAPDRRTGPSARRAAAALAAALRARRPCRRSAVRHGAGSRLGHHGDGPAGHALAAAEGAEALGSTALDGDGGTDGIGQVLLHLGAGRRQLRVVGDHRSIDVARLPPRLAHPAGGLGEQLDAVGAGPRRVGVGEVLADVAQPGRAQQGVGAGVGDDVGVAVAAQGPARCRR